MLKKFRVWVEEHEKERRVKKQIYDRLHFNSDIDPSTVKIKGLKLIDKAIDELGIEDENTVNDLKNWIKNNPGATLTQFITQIDIDDVPDEQELPGDDAQLPPEQQTPSANQGQMPPVPPEGQLPNMPQKPLSKKPPLMGM